MNEELINREVDTRLQEISDFITGKKRTPADSFKGIPKIRFIRNWLNNIENSLEFKDTTILLDRMASWIKQETFRYGYTDQEKIDLVSKELIAIQEDLNAQKVDQRDKKEEL